MEGSRTARLLAPWRAVVSETLEGRRGADETARERHVAEAQARPSERENELS